MVNSCNFLSIKKIKLNEKLIKESHKNREKKNGVIFNYFKVNTFETND